MSKLTKIQVASFRKKILYWLEANKRDLPWRHDRDPYHILLSEIMLQQTQVSRVIPKYESWINRWPTIIGLSNARSAEVLEMWSGLGYNRRALYLLKIAQDIVRHERSEVDLNYPPTLSFPSRRETILTHTQNKQSMNVDLPAFRPSLQSEASRQVSPLQGNDSILFPQTEQEWMKLPGIGEYTARAVLCFAFNQQLALVDTNIRKVISLEFFKGEPPASKIVQEIANQLLPLNKAYAWNQALMDYSAAVLNKDHVPIPKQSKFKGSNRYYRGQIIKLLIKEKQIPIAELGPLVKKDFHIEDNTFIRMIIEGLEKDKLVKVRDTMVCLP